MPVSQTVYCGICVGGILAFIHIAHHWSAHPATQKLDFFLPSQFDASTISDESTSDILSDGLRSTEKR